MFKKTRYRSLERTLVVDSRVREVTQNHNTAIRSQTHAVGVPEDEIFNSISVIVGPKGYALPATKGFLHIDTGEPLKIQIGSVYVDIHGQLLLTGALPESILVSEVEQRVHVIQY
ncbi:hypothetical protein JA33_124 [Dickeya phage vB_DsoM_JA33]|uniref:Uncharacterized protein n=3 Tax=Salmondvirus JA11 TaxID=2734141 RepID=A0A384ZWA9_9CAUD|nr:hypothetical protein HOU32_gp124 [Dickeya phage vB_DsoM_JA11]AXG66528.1 hypothetical protein JA13_125 [Dickeya phage vB_DsoM_JA13]AXG67498.1 hypothetical protein JA33_124 [Dickeya phage vB_DsoM_JA33]AYD79929.1 hypothetical protein JA11_124 [Dickeya phage vB_DsoM_JA11]